MISRQLTDILQSVRDLGLEVVDVGGVERVRSSNDASTFSAKLANLQRALEAFDQAEANKAEDSYSFLLLATKALAEKSRKKGDRRDTYDIVNDAIQQYDGEAWAGATSESPAGLRPKKRKMSDEGADAAVQCSSSYIERSREKALLKGIAATPSDDAATEYPSRTKPGN